MTKLRTEIIKLAHEQPELRRHLVPLIRQAGKFEEAVKGRKFRNPDTGNRVTFKALPVKEQAKIREQWSKRQQADEGKKAPEPKEKAPEQQPKQKAPEPKEKAPEQPKEKAPEQPKEKGKEEHGEGGEKSLRKSLKQDFNKFLSDLKGAKENIVKSLKAAPDTVKEVMVDKEKRKEFTSKVAEYAKKSPKTIAKKIATSAKKELHEIKHATHAAKKLLKKPPGPFSADDKKAFIATGAYVASAVLAAVPPLGSAIAAAGSVGASFAKHVAIKTVHEMLDEGFVGYEWAHEVFHATHLVTGHLAAEKDAEVDSDELIEGFVRLISEQMQKGLTEADMKKIMAGSDGEA